MGRDKNDAFAVRNECVQARTICVAKADIMDKPLFGSTRDKDEVHKIPGAGAKNSPGCPADLSLGRGFAKNLAKVALNIVAVRA
jgi:hypothetical protein